ncbi:MAG TPA: helix-turn-helix domain-containing protein [Acidimicrobiales bacterium]|nr:helix-turn-helix domain-containing protein [Acidimicrobiales bacterium]
MRGSDDVAEDLGDGGRVARNRRRRSEAFLTAGLRIVTEEGIDALTMARLADELDTAVGSVYRYYSSKDELVAAIQAHAIGRLHRSHDLSVEQVAAAVSARLAGAEGTDSPALVRLVVLGRWFCGAAERYPEEVRLLQMVSARRTSTLTPAAAAGLVPSTMSLVAAVGSTIDAAADAGDLRPGDGIGRAIVWLMAFGGVFAADDLERYVPGVLGGGRLVRQLNVDLIVGWGAPPDAVERIEQAVDALAGTPPLVH